MLKQSGKQTTDAKPLIKAAFRLVGFCLIAGGFSLAQYRSPGMLFWAIASLGSGIFFVAEPDLLAHVLPVPRPEKDQKQTKSDTVAPSAASSLLLGGSSQPVAQRIADAVRQAVNDSRRGLFEVALLLVAIVVLFCLQRPQVPDKPLFHDYDPTTLCADIARCLPKVPDNFPQKPNQPSGPVTLEIDPALRQALLDFLKDFLKKPAAPQPAEQPGGGLLVLQIGLLIFIAGAVVYLLRKRPQTAPAVGATAAAAYVLQYPKSLSNIDPKTYLIFCWLYFGITIATFALLMFPLAVWFRKTKGGVPITTSPSAGDPVPASPPNNETAKPNDKTDKTDKTMDWLFSSAFALVVLSWAIVISAYRPGPPTSQPQPPVQPHISSRSVQRLPAVPTFPRSEPRDLSSSSGGPDGIEALKKQLADPAQRPGIDIEPGDTLLLLGSSDCIPYRADKKGKEKKDADNENDALATRRANAVKTHLDSTLKSLKVDPVTFPLKQHSDCREAPNLRAVYSFLIPSAPVQ